MFTLLNNAPVTDFNGRSLGATKSPAMQVEMRLFGWLKQARTAIGLWRWRARQRRVLARMTMLELRDIGITRSEAVREYHKPFWQG